MLKEKPKLLPSISLKDVYGPNLVLNPRPSFSNYGWLPTDPVKLDFLTGSPLLIAGTMPVICSHFVATENVMFLLSNTGLEPAPFCHIYHTSAEYQNIMDSIRKQKKKLVVNHLHPSNEIKRNDYWIDPDIIAFLNNKANLNCLVPSEHIPRRTVVLKAEIKKVLRGARNYPLILKAATGLSAGGGYGVFICKCSPDVDDAYESLQTCEAVVLEEYIDIHKNYCIQFAGTVNGQIIYLGISEQIVDPSGIYGGNWLDKNHIPPKTVIDLGRQIMENACGLGYSGIGGFDIVVSRDNRVLVIDLNFRLNGSTPALLLEDSIVKTFNASVLLFRNWKARITQGEFLSVSREAIEHSRLIPISLYDPLSGPCSDSVYFSGILFGASREDVLAKQLVLARYGIR